MEGGVDLRDHQYWIRIVGTRTFARSSPAHDGCRAGYLRGPRLLWTRSSNRSPNPSGARRRSERNAIGTRIAPHCPSVHPTPCPSGRWQFVHPSGPDQRRPMQASVDRPQRTSGLRACSFSFLAWRFSLSDLPDFLEAVFRGDLSVMSAPFPYSDRSRGTDCLQ